MLQIRTQNGVYNPHRDIVQLFPNVIGMQAANHLAAHSWPAALREFAAHSNLDPKALVPAANALAAYVAAVTSSDVPDPTTAFVRAGFDRLPAAVLLALFAAIGEVTVKVFFRAARAASRGDQTVPGADALGEALDRAAHAAAAGSARTRASRAVEVIGHTAHSILSSDLR